MQDDITIDIFSKNDDDEDFEENFGNGFVEKIGGSTPEQQGLDDDYSQKYEELRKSVSQLFFGICTLFETVQAKTVAVQEPGEDGAANSSSGSHSPEVRVPRPPTPWWAWANLGISGIILLVLFVSLIF